MTPYSEKRVLSKGPAFCALEMPQGFSQILLGMEIQYQIQIGRQIQIQYPILNQDPTLDLILSHEKNYT